MFLHSVINEFVRGFKHVSRRQCIQQDKKMRDQMNDYQLDQMIMDSMPASDAPSTY